MSCTPSLTKRITIKAVATARVWGRCEIMETTMTKKDLVKGARNIEEMTGVLSQTVKLYEGLYSKKCKDTSGLTVEQWMEQCGVSRFVTKSGTKKGYTPGLILGAWHPMMRRKKADGTIQARVYKRVPAKYVNEDSNEIFDVFTREEAEKRVAQGGNNGGRIVRTMLVDVPDTRWSIRVINQGLTQKFDHKKWEEREVESGLAWEAVEECFIIVEKQGENGETVRTMQEISKEEVKF